MSNCRPLTPSPARLAGSSTWSKYTAIWLINPSAVGIRLIHTTAASESNVWRPIWTFTSPCSSSRLVSSTSHAHARSASRRMSPATGSIGSTNPLSWSPVIGMTCWAAAGVQLTASQINTAIVRSSSTPRMIEAYANRHNRAGFGASCSRRPPTSQTGERFAAPCVRSALLTIPRAAVRSHPEARRRNQRR